MLEEFNYNNAVHKELLFEIINDPSIQKYLGNGQILDLIKVKIVKKFVFIVNEIAVGMGFIIPLKEREVEIRYCISKNHRGNNYSSQLVKLLLNYMPNDYTIFADIQLDNKASAKAVLNNGFQTEDNFVFHINKR